MGTCTADRNTPERIVNLRMRYAIIIAILIAAVGASSLVVSLRNLDTKIAEITQTDREIVLWTVTQIEVTLSDFRHYLNDILLETEVQSDERFAIEFDIVYSRLSQVEEGYITEILDTAGATDVVTHLLSLRDGMADIVDNSADLGPQELMRLYDMANDAQRIWHPYKYTTLDISRTDRLRRSQNAAEALKNVRSHLIFGLFAVLVAALGILSTYLVARRNRMLLTRLQNDSLTGCYSRTGFEAIAASRKKEASSLVVGVIDINDLKIVNDTHGHQVGDDHIKRVGKALRETFRQQDCVARVGGDEFWLLTDAPAEIVESKLADVQTRIRSENGDGGPPWKNEGISFGVSRVSQHSDIPSAIKAADEIMYDQKREFKSRRDFSETSS
jgi:diguanylate cyclase (GGDEF)-like protein